MPLLFRMPLLAIPTRDDVNRISKAFLLDLESFTVTDKTTKEIKPVICGVCDSIPPEAQWSTFVELKEFIKLCQRCNIEKKFSLKAYKPEIQDQYTAKHEALKDFILSPETYVTAENKVLVCKQCLLELQRNSKKQEGQCCPPTESIINGYMIGDAPDLLKNLNPVELSLITKTSTQCQSWILFCGCHQSIKGWHTFFKGQPGQNVGNMIRMTESGWKGHIIVVLFRLFTSQQSMLTRERVLVTPGKVIAGWKWLKHNNFRFRLLEIPHIDSIPFPFIMDQER